MKRKYFTFVLFLSIITAGLLFYIWQRFEAVNIGYEIQEKLKQVEDLNFEISELEIEINSLLRFDRIEKIAVEELGMVYPKQDDIVILKVKE